MNRRSLSAIVLLMVMGIAGAVSTAAGDMVLPLFERHVLPNGLTVIMVEKRLLPLVDGQLVIMSGAASDLPGKEGLANLVARMLMRGAAGLDAAAINALVDDSGADLLSTADWETSRIRFHALREELPSMLRLCAELVMLPEFDARQLDREKGLIISETRAIESNNGRLADRWFFSKLHSGTRRSLPAQGTSGTLSAVTIADVSEFHRTHYAPNNAVLLLGGDIASSDVREVEAAFSAWPRGRIPVGATEPQIRLSGRTAWIVDKPDMAQCQIRIGIRGMPWSHPDRHAARVLNTYFGGGYSCLLMEELRRKRGWTYGVGSEFDFGRTTGRFRIWTFTENAKAGEVLQLMLDLIRRTRDGNIPNRAIEEAKQYLIGRTANAFQSPLSLASELLRYEMAGLPLQGVRDGGDEILNLTADQVKDAAAKYLDLDNALILILGRRAEIEEPLKQLFPDLKLAHFRDAAGEVSHQLPF